MPSQRHTAGSPVAGDAPPGANSSGAAELQLPPAVADAARAAVLAVGVRRATLTDIARRAGVSRMTLYRLVPDVETLVLQVLSAEFTTLLDRAERAAARRRTARSRLVACVVDVVRALPSEPLFTRVLDVDPDLLLPFVTDRIGTTQLIALARLRRMVADGHADGSIRRGDLEAQTTSVLLICTPFVLSARLLDAPSGAAGVRRDAVLRELGALLDKGLAP